MEWRKLSNELQLATSPSLSQLDIFTTISEVLRLTMSVHLRSTASPLASFLRTERHSRQFADMAVVAGAARVEAHRLALAASSTFFQGVLAR